MYKPHLDVGDSWTRMATLDNHVPWRCNPPVSRVRHIAPRTTQESLPWRCPCVVYKRAHLQPSNLNSPPHVSFHHSRSSPDKIKSFHDGKHGICRVYLVHGRSHACRVHDPCRIPPPQRQGAGRGDVHGEHEEGGQNRPHYRYRNILSLCCVTRPMLTPPWTSTRKSVWPSPGICATMVGRCLAQLGLSPMIKPHMEKCVNPPCAVIDDIFQNCVRLTSRTRSAMLSSISSR